MIALWGNTNLIQILHLQNKNPYRQADTPILSFHKEEIMRIPVSYSIDVKYIPSTYKAYQAITLFGGVYKVQKPQTVRSMRFMEEL